MKTKWLGWISFLTLISTTLWLILLIWDMATAGPLETFQQVLSHAQKGDWKFTLTYLNAGFVTLSATAWMGGLYVIVRDDLPGWTLIGVVFVPVYSTLNLLAYLSQITLVPALLETTADPVMIDIALLLLQQSLQLLPSSFMGFINGLAYAILGIPSMIFGLALTKRGLRSLKISGWLLTFNGIACILGIIGYLLGNPLLSFGTVFGGAIFWLALFPLTFTFLRGQDG
jgi:hypothetical protein